MAYQKTPNPLFQHSVIQNLPVHYLHRVLEMPALIVKLLDLARLIAIFIPRADGCNRSYPINRCLVHSSSQP